MGMVISMFMRDAPKERPLTHDLMALIFEGFGISVERVVVTELRNSTYYARLILKQENELGKKIVEVDARPSDCIALATARKRPIFVARRLFDQVEDMSEMLPKMNERQRRHPPSREPETAPSEPTRRAPLSYPVPAAARKTVAPLVLVWGDDEFAVATAGAPVVSGLVPGGGGDGPRDRSTPARPTAGRPSARWRSCARRCKPCRSSAPEGDLVSGLQLPGRRAHRGRRGGDRRAERPGPGIEDLPLGRACGS